MRISKIIPSVGVLAMLMAAPAHAQESDVADDTSEEIVVTGTSIRGVAPAGASVIGVTEEAVEASGAQSATQVLATLPQLSDFNNVPTVQGSNNYRLATNRPNLRNLPGGVSSTSATLVLMDGHRLAGNGVVQTFPDPDIIPNAVLQRVEVVPDGGSSIYGADAVGGVINFITRRDFDGVQVDAKHGFGEDFGMTDVAVTAGTGWDSGSAYVAYSYSQRDPLYGRDRDYVRDINWVTGEPLELRCNPANVTQGPLLVSAAGGEEVRCDDSRSATIFGAERRDSVFAGFSQDLGESLRFDLRAWYTQRQTNSDGGPLMATVSVPGGSPFSLSTSGLNPAAAQTVSFNFAPVDPRSNNTSLMNTYGFTPEITWDLPADWQMRAFANYGHSQTTIHNPGVDNAFLQEQVNLGNLNPYHLNSTRDVALEAINRIETFGQGEDEITNSRVVFDGPLFDLPAGEVRVALGAEYLYEEFQVNTTDGYVIGSDLTFSEDNRRSMAYFAELNVPVFSEEQNIPLVHSLALSLAARMDDFSDQEDARTSPRIGLTYEPVDWIALRGHWGESFQAPGLADTATATSRYSAFASVPTTLLVKPEDIPGFVTTDWSILAVQGSTAGLKPQEATTWSVGFDISPPVVPNLEVGMTYFNIDYTGRITNPTAFLPTLWQDFGGQFLYDPGNPGPSNPNDDAVLTAVRDFLGNDPNAEAAIAQLIAADKPIYAILDVRNQNGGKEFVEGFDAVVRYSGDTPFGTWYTSFNANYLLTYQRSVGPASPLSDNLAGEDGTSRFGATLTVGTTIGEHWLAQLSYNHRQGTRITTPLGIGTPADPEDDQDFVDDFNTANLYVQYDVLGEGLGEDVQFSLGVTNVANEDPPIYRGTYSGNFSQAGYAVGTLGRVISLGISKRF